MKCKRHFKYAYIYRWLVKKDDIIGLFPSTHASIVRVQVTDAEPTKINQNKVNSLTEGWDSCTDNESGDKYYFNYETG